MPMQVDVDGAYFQEKMPKLAARLKLPENTYFNSLTDNGDILYWPADEGFPVRDSEGIIRRDAVSGEPYFSFPRDKARRIPAHSAFDDLEAGTKNVSLLALMQRQEAKDALKQSEVTVHERDAGFAPKAKGNAAAQMHLNSQDISYYDELVKAGKTPAEIGQAAWEYLKSRMRSIRMENMASQNADSTSGHTDPASAQQMTPAQEKFLEMLVIQQMGYEQQRDDLQLLADRGGPAGWWAKWTKIPKLDALIAANKSAQSGVIAQGFTSATADLALGLYGNVGDLIFSDANPPIRLTDAAVNISQYLYDYFAGGRQGAKQALSDISGVPHDALQKMAAESVPDEWRKIKKLPGDIWDGITQTWKGGWTAAEAGHYAYTAGAIGPDLVPVGGAAKIGVKALAKGVLRGDMSLAKALGRIDAMVAADSMTAADGAFMKRYMGELAEARNRALDGAGKAESRALSPIERDAEEQIAKTKARAAELQAKGDGEAILGKGRAEKAVKPSSAENNATAAKLKAKLTAETERLTREAENISTAKMGKQVTAPRNLKEKLLWDNVVKHPDEGVMLPLNSDPRFPNSAGFQKMYQRTYLSNGDAIEIHYQYNKYTDKAYDIKITTPERIWWKIQ